MTNPDETIATIVSCDIVGHGLEPDHGKQIERIRGLNEVVRESLNSLPSQSVVWASGGDGGHVAFLFDNSIGKALELVQSLRWWASTSGSLLRVTCHRGLVSTIEGADGRIQLVGQGINLCGSLIGFGSPNHVIATSVFCDYFVTCRVTDSSLPELRFGSQKVIYLKNASACRVCAVAFPSDPPQTWTLERSDHIRLERSALETNPWQLIYRSKRLLQINSADPQAMQALNEISLDALALASPTTTRPILAGLRRTSLAPLLLGSELVERDDGDIICQQHDTGDSMFIVLKGEIGIVSPRQYDDATQPEPFDIRIGEGGIVGELSLALNRSRTATLQAIGDTAFLAIDYRSLMELIRNERLLQIAFQKFLEERTAEHLCRNAPYLRLDYTVGQETRDREPWERLANGITQIVLDSAPSQSISFGSVPDLRENAIYVIASGSLVDSHENHTVQKRLTDENFDIVFAHLPGLVVDACDRFKVDPSDQRRITIVRVSDAAIQAYAKERRAGIVKKLRRRLAAQMVFDVFLSYTKENADLASDWKRAFVAASLSVYMNDPKAMNPFEREIELALSESRVFVPLISRAALHSQWVKREIDRRKEIFDGHANILPVETEPGLAEKMTIGLSPIETGQRGSDQEKLAMAGTIEIIRGVVAGDLEPPFRTRAKIIERSNAL